MQRECHLAGKAEPLWVSSRGRARFLKRQSRLPVSMRGPMNRFNFAEDFWLLFRPATRRFASHPRLVINELRDLPLPTGTRMPNA